MEGLLLLDHSHVRWIDKWDDERYVRVTAI